MITLKKKFIVVALLAFGLFAQPLRMHGMQDFDPSKTAAHIMGKAAKNELLLEKKACKQIRLILEKLKAATQANLSTFDAFQELEAIHPALAMTLSSRIKQSDLVERIDRNIKQFALGEMSIGTKLDVYEQISTLFAYNEHENNEPLSPLFDHKTYSDELDIISKNGEKSLFSILQKSMHLNLGTLKLAKTLGQPTSNLLELQRRQAILQEIATNQSLRFTISAYLDEIKKIEFDILSYWNSTLTSRMLAAGPFITGSHTLSPSVNMLQYAPGMTRTLQNYDKDPRALCFFGVLLAQTQYSFLNTGIDTFSSFFSQGASTLLNVPRELMKNLIPHVGGLTCAAMPFVLHSIFATLKQTAHIEQALDDFFAQPNMPTPTSFTTDSFMPVSKKITFASSNDAEKALTRLAKHPKFFSKPDANNDHIIIVSFKPEVAQDIASIIKPSLDFALKMIASALLLYYLAPTIVDTSNPINILTQTLSSPILVTWAGFEALSNAANGLHGIIKSFIFGKIYTIDPLKEGLYSQVDMIDRAQDFNKKLAFFIQKTKELKTILETNKVISKHLNCLPHLGAGSMIKSETSAEFKTLLQTLNTADITDATAPYQQISWWRKLNPLRIIRNRTVGVSHAATYKVITENKQAFSHLLEAVAELDMWTGLANLFLQHQSADKDHRFCFAEFTQDTPYLAAQKLWHPYLLNRMNVQEITPYESLELGGQEQKTALIYGANAKGKSTLLRATANATILALCFGIAPAQKFVLTPPSKILVSIKSTDKPEKGLSGYTSHLDTLHKILNQASALHAQNEHALIIIDELCQASTARAGERASFEILKDNFGNSKNNALSLITVHKEMPAGLIKTDEAHFKFYGFQPDRSINQLTNFEELKKLLDHANKESYDKVKSYGLIH
ncbi:hypothetical protein IPF37_00040 [bacterium]|nr:MAG: hypothetical protein IPF37_00040 [bacterium]